MEERYKCINILDAAAYLGMKPEILVNLAVNKQIPWFPSAGGTHMEFNKICLDSWLLFSRAAFAARHGLSLRKSK